MSSKETDQAIVSFWDSLRGKSSEAELLCSFSPPKTQLSIQKLSNLEVLNYRPKTRPEKAQEELKKLQQVTQTTSKAPLELLKSFARKKASDLNFINEAQLKEQHKKSLLKLSRVYKEKKKKQETEHKVLLEWQKTLIKKERLLKKPLHKT